MEDYNPWWLKEEDPTLVEYFGSPIQWVPKIINRLTTTPFSLNFLVGPRQVGKSTTIKLFIQRLLKQDYDPWAIFYYSCDELTDFRELGDVLDNYLALRDSHGVNSSFLFLDEITFVTDWWRAVKSRIDRSKFLKDVLCVSGSASLDLLKQKEYFPGRRGHGQDIIFYPLDFGEYCTLWNSLPLQTTTSEDLSSVIKLIDLNSAFYDTLQGLFRSYLLTGGFPLPIREFVKHNSVTSRTRKVYLDWIMNDCLKMRKQTGYMKEIIAQVLQSRVSPVSWTGLAKATSINSPKTVKSYIEMLEEIFLFRVLPLRFPDGKIAHAKNKKIHVTDPFINDLLANYTRVTILEETKVESIVATHLARIMDVYYWRNKTEIDVIATTKKHVVGVEVKWSPRIRRKPRYPGLLMTLTKKTIPLFLASINWETRINPKNDNHSKSN